MPVAKEQSVEARLRAAIERASRRLAQKSQTGQSVRSSVTDRTKSMKKEPGTAASRVAASQFLGSVAGLDQKHVPAIVEKGERVLTTEQTKAYDRTHPNARKQPMSLGRIPLFDEGGEISDDDHKPLGSISLPQDLQDAQNAAMRPLPGQGNASLEARPIEKGDASMETRPSEQPSATDQLRDQLDNKKLQAANKGPAGLMDLGTALIHENQIDQHEARTQMPQLPQISPEMPQYMGPGKPVPAGELIPAKQLPGDEYKYPQQNLDQRIEAARNKAVDETLTPAERASAQTLADQLALRREELRKPAATSFVGKLGRGFERAGNILGNIVAPGTMALIPGTDLNKTFTEAGTLGRINTDVSREKEIAETDAASTKATKSPWKPASGEQFTQYDASGKPIRQLFTNENTGDQQWRDVPAAGLPKIQTSATAPTGGASPAASSVADGSYFGTKEAANRPIGDAGLKQYGEQTKSAALRIPKGYDVAPPTFTKDDTESTAKDKMKDYETAVNNAILADRADKSQAARETAAETRERRAEDRKDRNTPVYAENSEGQTILTNKYDAQLNGQAYEVATPGDINKDRQAIRQLNDVQLNVSRYTKAASEAAKTQPTTKDYVNMHSVLNKAGALDLNVAIGEGGSIKIPVLSSMIEGLNREINSEAYADLSPQGKALLDGYIRSMSAVPAYQKALTGIGRSNKEMLDLELANIPNPTMKPTDIQHKLSQFQENIERASEGFPKLPGLKSAKEVRETTEKSKAESVPSVGNAKYHLQGAKGEIFSNDGTTWYDKDGKQVGK